MTMNPYNAYQQFTSTTAIYPQQSAAEYLTLGLNSEAAECVEAFLKPSRGDSIVFANNIGKELGDVQWYAAQLARAYHFDFGDIVDEAKKQYPGIGVSGFADGEELMSRITVEGGLIAGKVKKQLRDGPTWLGEQREESRQYIRDRLVRIVTLSMRVSDWLYANGAESYSTYDLVLIENRKKLTDRQARGALRGDGDNR